MGVLLGSFYGGVFVRCFRHPLSVDGGFGGLCGTTHFLFPPPPPPPFQAFSPELKKFYKAHHEGKKFELVFVSSDRDAASFAGYFKDMPWPAIPFGDASLRALGSKLKVEGIPTLAVLDARTGELVTKDGRSAVSADAEAGSFPWKPRSVWDVLGESAGKGEITAANGAAVSLADLKAEGKSLGLLFSASWCPPCRAFEPVLRAWYLEHGRKHNVELLFVSSDNDAASYREYRHEMPWLSLAFEARGAKSELGKIFEVEGIPTLLFIDHSGKVIVPDGRGRITAEPAGWPWPPKAVEEAEVALGSINDRATVILFTDKLTAPQDDSVDAFRAVAAEFFAKDPDARQYTILGAEHEFSEQIRGFLGIAEEPEADDALRVVFLNIPEGQKALMGGDDKTGAFSADDFRVWLQAVIDGDAPTKGIRE
jgi:thiol-disulfide isomerase/thioredoxin